jgi:peptidyl-tRNA hydrolase, PTH1 family
VGLGNPGPRYAETRHNAGFLVAERFAADCGFALRERAFGGCFGQGVLRGGPAPLGVAVLLPGTYMNRSGEAVQAALAGLGIADAGRDLLVILDDMDLPFGRLRLRPGGGAGGHRGLADILERLGRRDVPRLRFGAGRPPEDSDPVEHVLERFSAEQARQLPARLERAALAVASALGDGATAAMNRFNQDPGETDPTPHG